MLRKCGFFGGFGALYFHHLNEYGGFTPMSAYKNRIGTNNQLLFYEPSTEIWENVCTTGDVPSPRFEALTAIIEDKVWLYGGKEHYRDLTHRDDVYELNMKHLVWSQIETNMPGPGTRLGSSFTPVTANHIVFHNGKLENKTTWILDVESHTWQQYPISDSHCRNYHTGIIGLKSDVIILGGDDEDFVDIVSVGCEDKSTCEGMSTPFFHVMLEPKTLQQLAMKILYKNRTQLPWKSLPSTLKLRMINDETE